MHTAFSIKLLLSVFLLSCTGNEHTAVLSGTVSNPGSDTISLEIERLHYKFSDPVIVETPVHENGSFRFEVQLSEPANFLLIYNNGTFPVYLAPGEHTQLTFNHAHFPGSIRVSGYARQHYQSLLTFLSETEALSRHKVRERQKFLRNQPNEYLNTHRNKISSAKEFLGETPFSYLIHRYTGEYLVGRLQEIRLRKNEPGINLELARLSVIREARIQRFFSYESQLAQRAGIRDFANEWIQTFDFRDNPETRSENAQNQVLTVAEEVRRTRWQLLEYTTDERAMRHAIMYLIAEEMGDFDYEAGAALLSTFEYELKKEPAYFEFLSELKNEISKTQPGMPAIPFTLQTADGKTVTLEDLQGRYVLLDFWASWCQPCIQEIPYMTEIYEAYDASDFEIVSVSLDENFQAWQNMLNRFEKPWIHSFDGTGFNQATFRSYRAGGIPFYVLISRDGTILRNNDFRPSVDLFTILEELVYSDLDHTYAGQR